MIRATHGIEVIDLSRAGATLADGSRRLKSVQLRDGLVIIELGGNDMLARVGEQQFGRDLESLVRQVQSPSRDLVMFELPLLPFDNAYGIEQRRIASAYHIALIPRRYFIDVLAAPGATLDGLHLTTTGQQQMAELVWSVIGGKIETSQF
jgi:lysophospholipase L1-like esterase